jgi:hypothetical protein
MTAPPVSELEDRLLRPAEPAGFSSAELEGLPEPVRRHLAQAIGPQTPLATCARLRMRGTIKVGRWLPFRAHQVLNPHHGLVWVARAAGVIAGADRYVDGVGAMDWKLLGLVTVAQASGPDFARSAAGRAGAEGMWVPTALLPRFGVRWSAPAGDRVTAAFAVGETPVEVRYRLDTAGRIRSFVLDRWGDANGTGTYGWYPFGGEVTGYRSFDCLTIPVAGRAGWFFGTDRWPDGEFMRYRITDLRLVTAIGRPPRRRVDPASSPMAT